MNRGRSAISAPAIGAALWFLLLHSAATAAQFSADIVEWGADGQPKGPSGKVYVLDNKARIETPDVADGFFLVDGDANAAFFVRPTKRVFMDAKQSSQLTQILIPLDLDDPCLKQQAMAANAGATESGGQWRCNRIGPEIIGGRETIAYSAETPRGERISEWIDLELKVVVKSRIEGGATFELKNVRNGAQAASLFEIPASYQKFDPRQLIEIIKQSDVWVEPVK